MSPGGHQVPDAGRDHDVTGDSRFGELVEDRQRERPAPERARGPSRRPIAAVGFWATVCRPRRLSNFAVALPAWRSTRRKLSGGKTLASKSESRNPEDPLSVYYGREPRRLSAVDPGGLRRRSGMSTEETTIGQGTPDIRRTGCSGSPSSYPSLSPSSSSSFWRVGTHPSFSLLGRWSPGRRFSGRRGWDAVREPPGGSSRPIIPPRVPVISLELTDPVEFDLEPQIDLAAMTGRGSGTDWRARRGSKAGGGGEMVARRRRGFSGWCHPPPGA